MESRWAVLSMTRKEVTMASNRLALTQGELQSRANTIRNQYAAAYQQAIDQAHSNVQALLDDWVGAASTEFADLWTEWRTSANQSHEALMEIAARMEKSGIAFQENEENIRRSIAQR